MSDEPVTARIARLEARVEIGELPGRYSRAIDDRDIDTLVQLFCEDGTFERADGTNSVTGRAAIERFYVDTLSGYGMSLHIPHAHVVERIEGDEASGWVLAHAELAVGDSYVVTALRYEDDYRREGGRWRFARRQISFWYFTDWTALPETVVSPDRKRFRTDPRPADLPESLPTYRAFVERAQRGS